jgi:hypothetical protein
MKYPKIAGRLQLEADRCEDPHVERLLEAGSLGWAGAIDCNPDWTSSNALRPFAKFGAESPNLLSQSSESDCKESSADEIPREAFS